MESLANIFVAIITFTHTLAPNANVAKVLDIDPFKKSPSVLSSEVEDTDNESNSTSEKQKRLEEIKKRNQERTSEQKQKRVELQQEREKEKQEFRQELSQVKSERKQEIVSKIDTNIEKLNQKWVEHFQKVLDRLTEILTKIESKSTNDQVVTKVNDAKAKITTAQQLVKEQSEKTYVIEITSETGIGQDVRTTINEFHNDIKNTKEAVQQARQAVVDALRTLKTIEHPENQNNEQ